MEVIYYTLIAACLYLVSNWILDRLEVSRGARFEYRSFIFFFIILTLAIIAFGLINLMMPSPVA
ncbi:MAG: hypothetical protein WCZ98_08060 [Sideroxydans sp.]